MSTMQQNVSQKDKMNGYYRFHARIYDATRWTFLFGRRRLMRLLATMTEGSGVFVEIGCGTGANLYQAAQQWPERIFYGLDISEPMLVKARQKLKKYANRLSLQTKAYGTEGGAAPAHTILLSYCLTMVNPGWERLLQQAAQDLVAPGYVAVVDFHQSPISWFRRWMGVNHVSLAGVILPYLQIHFKTVYFEEKKAFGGLWTYFIFIGQKSNP